MKNSACLGGFATQRLRTGVTGFGLQIRRFRNGWIANPAEQGDYFYKYLSTNSVGERICILEVSALL